MLCVDIECCDLCIEFGCLCGDYVEIVDCVVVIV